MNRPNRVTIRFLMLLILVISCVTPAAEAESPQDREPFEYSQQGKLVPLGESAAIGGGFLLVGEVAESSRASKGDWVLTKIGGGGSAAGYLPESSSCLCGGGIFADGFETGSTSVWDAVSP